MNLIEGKENCDFHNIRARLQKQSQHYVRAIENYTGSDPLKLWYEYICWMDEVFAGPVDDQDIFENVLQSCLATFESDVNYKQDRRLVKIFIKFVSINILISNDENYCEHFSIFFFHKN